MMTCLMVGAGIALSLLPSIVLAADRICLVSQRDIARIFARHAVRAILDEPRDGR